LEKLEMIQSIYHFKLKKGFIFIIRQERSRQLPNEQTRVIIEELGNAFHRYYPDAREWDGKSNTFDDFSTECDDILKNSPVRQGQPFLLRLSVKPPFLLVPVAHLLPITAQNQETFNDLLSSLNKYLESVGRRDVRRLTQGSFVLPMNDGKIVYIHPFECGEGSNDYVYLLCFSTHEQFWFVFYQLIGLIKKRTDYILPIISNYIESKPTRPTSNLTHSHTARIYDLISNWANLNQYVGALQASLFENFYRSRLDSASLSEDQIRFQILLLLSKFSKDISKLVFALLVQQQVLVVGVDDTAVRRLLGALLSLYPHPSASLWEEGITDYLLVGVHPSKVRFFEERDLVVVNLDTGEISGGEANDFCASLIEETKTLISDISVIEARRYLLGKITSIFSVLKLVLETFYEGDDETRLMNILRICSKDLIRLMARMCQHLNPILAKKIQRLS
ncbi:MAG TPA: hypothetical protein VJ044_17055, partial [Candidatus Hodarchaeales archaeon]|nr:hypothetical protein [Candidatus Hodarchaeales archaeon]